MDKTIDRPPFLRALGGFIFFSRWLQAPLYLGLIVAQAVYVLHFFSEIWHMVYDATKISEGQLLIIVLQLVDVVMIANLLVMVIVGGYETFVSRLNLKNHPDEPEWLSHVNAGVLKVKLATALIGISSVQLLTTFVRLANPNIKLSGGEVQDISDRDIRWQIVVHLTFVISALLLAVIDRITVKTASEAKAQH